MPITQVYDALETRPEGLSDVEVRERLARVGPNELREIPRKPLIVRFGANFTHLMALLLWAGGAVAFVAQMPQLGVAVWLVNLINGSFSFWQEFKAERATQALRRLLPTAARVRRNGQECRVAASELVPGDVMLLEEGDHISADARLVLESELQVDQATLTGESRPVRRHAMPASANGTTRMELPNLVFAGTNVASGTGMAVVFATAMNTEFGRIARLTQGVGEELSPLQREIEVVTRVVSVIAIGVGAVFFGLSVLLAGMKLSEGFIFALGMIVAFVPEGLLPTVTLSLAMGVQRMARRQAIVKRLSAVETLGCTGVICTDKTGTLTQNEMTVRELWVSGRRYSVNGVGYSPDGTVVESGLEPRPGIRQPNDQQVVPQPNDDLRNFLVAAGLCNNARLLPPNDESARWTVLGDPTEAALRVVAVKGGVNLEAELIAAPRERELPFDSRRKRMCTIHRVGRNRVAFVKGAPREVLALCERVRQIGHDSPLDAATRSSILETNDEYARAGLRVLGVAMRTLPDGPLEFSSETIEQHLSFLGLAAMMDPPRPEVAEAVQKCHRAGIRVVMITGDYGLTAESIAQRIGIVRGSRPRIVTGAELEVMTDAELEHALHDEVIFARVAPEQKLRVVTVLQSTGQVVAVTGDGVNDAPALKKADIGVAMGLSGTDVAREAADMILTDDNFASIVSAIEEGRTVYANIKKFTGYIFTSNTPEAVPFITFAFSGGRIPLALNIMQILSVDLGTDLVPALALGAEPPEPGVMDRPPRRPDEHVITPGLLVRAYLWLGLIQSLAAMAAFYYLFWTNGHPGQWLDLPSSGPLYAAATTMTLAAVVVTQIGNVFAQRTERASIFRIGLFSNRLVWVGIATELVVILGIVYLPALQRIFGTHALSLQDWGFLLAWTPALLMADEARKWLERHLKRRATRTKGAQRREA
jgi:potassium/sodium efflux P-type ATPase